MISEFGDLRGTISKLRRKRAKADGTGTTVSPKTKDTILVLLQIALTRQAIQRPRIVAASGRAADGCEAAKRKSEVVRSVTEPIKSDNAANMI